MNDLRKFLMNLSLEKLLSPLAKETVKVNRIFKEAHILGYRSFMLKFVLFLNIL
jgi:VanZ family protein